MGRGRISLIVVLLVVSATGCGNGDPRFVGRGTVPGRERVGPAAEMIPAAAIVEAVPEDGQGIVSLGTLPASFEGDLPSAAGPRIRYHLDLFANHVFVLRREKLGPGVNPPFDVIGSWAASVDGGRIMLTGADRTPILFSVQEDNLLYMLDQAGRAMRPESSYRLMRTRLFAPAEPRLVLRGEYRGGADGGIFEECQTGWRLPVVPRGDYESLDSAYSRTRHLAGEPLLVTLVGRIVHRRSGDEPSSQMSLVVERLIGAWPGETCASRASTD